MQRKPFSIGKNRPKTNSSGIFRNLEDAYLESFSGGDRGVFCEDEGLDTGSRSVSEDQFVETIALNFGKIE